MKASEIKKLTSEIAQVFLSRIESKADILHWMVVLEALGTISEEHDGDAEGFAQAMYNLVENYR